MFKRKTLFVLGAGASAEVGLPVGVTLAKTIADLLDVRRGGPEDKPGDLLLAQLYERKSLANSGYHSAAWASPAPWPNRARFQSVLALD